MEVWQKATSAVVVLAPAAVLVYDVLALWMAGKEATITHVVQQWSKEYHELPWAAAGLFLWLWLHLFGALLLSTSPNK